MYFSFMKRIIAVYLSLLGYSCLSISIFGAETKVGEGSAGDTDFTGSNTWDADGATFLLGFFLRLITMSTV